MLRVEICRALSAAEEGGLAALAEPGNPFVTYPFLRALEDSGSVGAAATGWMPRHVLVREGDELVGALPLYVKLDSYGEFIFDWAWAEAAMRAGLAYYPKLVAAVPFTPASGARLLVHPAAGAAEAQGIRAALIDGIGAAAAQTRASSVHVLFCRAEEAALLAPAGFMPRLSSQFHWRRDPRWTSFDDYLAALRAPSRKQVRRERAVAQGHGLRLCMLAGDALSEADVRALYLFYRSTLAEKGAVAYLQPGFFAALRGPLSAITQVAMAYDGDTAVAGALYFTQGTKLYGRYWGYRRPPDAAADDALARLPYDCLHFELCYYMPIAWALAHGIEHFEAGAQGEHKLRRGLLPSPCHSAHLIVHPQLRAAVAQFLPQEAAAVTAQMDYYGQHSPYRRAS